MKSKQVHVLLIFTLSFCRLNPYGNLLELMLRCWTQICWFGVHEGESCRYIRKASHSAYCVSLNRCLLGEPAAAAAVAAVASICYVVATRV